MAAWTDVLSVVSSIVGIISLLGLILAIAAFCLDRKKRAAEIDLGRICCSQDEMGYFAIKSPSLWNPLHYTRKVKLPVVPDITAIIEAGDDMAFTSSLFDSIPANHDEVCWLGIYEGFFNELAWRDNSHWKSLWNDRELRRYAKMAEKHIAQATSNSRKVIREYAQRTMIDSSKAGREQTRQAASDSSKRAKVESGGSFGVEPESQARNFDRWEMYRRCSLIGTVVPRRLMKVTIVI